MLKVALMLAMVLGVFLMAPQNIQAKMTTASYSVDTMGVIVGPWYPVSTKRVIVGPWMPIKGMRY